VILSQIYLLQLVPLVTAHEREILLQSKRFNPERLHAIIYLRLNYFNGSLFAARGILNLFDATNNVFEHLIIDVADHFIISIIRHEHGLVV